MPVCICLTARALRLDCAGSLKRYSKAQRRKQPHSNAVLQIKRAFGLRTRVVEVPPLDVPRIQHVDDIEYDGAIVVAENEVALEAQIESVVKRQSLREGLAIQGQHVPWEVGILLDTHDRRALPSASHTEAPADVQAGPELVVHDPIQDERRVETIRLRDTGPRVGSLAPCNTERQPAIPFVPTLPVDEQIQAVGPAFNIIAVQAGRVRLRGAECERQIMELLVIPFRTPTPAVIELALQAQCEVQGARRFQLWIADLRQHSVQTRVCPVLPRRRNSPRSDSDS